MVYDSSTWGSMVPRMIASSCEIVQRMDAWIGSRISQQRWHCAREDGGIESSLCGACPSLRRRVDRPVLWIATWIYSRVHVRKGDGAHVAATPPRDAGNVHGVPVHFESAAVVSWYSPLGRRRRKRRKRLFSTLDPPLLLHENPKAQTAGGVCDLIAI